MKINTKRNKNTNKKAIVLCGLLLLAFLVSTSISTASTTPLKPPVNPEFTAYKQKLVGGSYSFNNKVVKNGYIPAPFQLTVSKRSRASATAPSSYDLRTQNKLTPIKDQGRAGSCWAFATYGSLESFLMPLETQDFSENNMKNVLSDSNPDGFDRDESGGGNNYMATAYLARWSGPVGENDDKYSDVSIFNQNELGLPTKKHVQDVIFIPDTDSQGIKDAVQKYGAVYTHMYYTDSSYSPANRSYYYSGSASINHAVDIVGWDDAFDKNKFINVPSGNGAFIVRNSWGTDWGDKGFFYVSYYDSKIGSSNSVFTAEKTDNYKNVYQYDPLGLTDIIGYGGTTCWGANVFTAKSKEILKAVSFYATDVNCNYQISIYTDPVSGPTSQTPVLSQSGTISTAGYHTVPLNSGIQLNQSQKYSIVLKLTTSGVTYPLAIEEPVPMYSSKAKANPGESYISSDGTSWTDITTYFTNTNVCLKAFTNNLSSDDIHPALTIKKTASPNTYSATGQTIAYNYKVTNSGDVSVSGTVINDNKTSVTINNGPLAPGSSVQGTATYTIKQADMDAGSVTNTAKAIGTAGTQTVTSTPVTATVTRSNPPSLVITKVGNPITYKAVGKKIKYIYTVTNTGAVPVSGIVINDNKNAVTIKRGTLAPNSSIKGTATYTITQADMDAGSVTNTAKAIGTAGTQTVTSNEVKVTITKK